MCGLTLVLSVITGAGVLIYLPVELPVLPVEKNSNLLSFEVDGYHLRGAPVSVLAIVAVLVRFDSRVEDDHLVTGL